MKFEKGVSNMATTLAERMSKFSGSPTSALIAKVAELKQQGKDIISLNVGEPDFGTPDYIKVADMKAIADNFTKYQERGSIEVAPLAYMRGRTLDDSFIILDEAQNTTPEQMKMFLTRLGFGSKAVITGDITQIDLPGGKQSGLREALRVLKNVEGIEQCYLTEKDVVRHELVQRIVKAYAEYESRKPKDKPDGGPKHRYVRRKEEK